MLHFFEFGVAVVKDAGIAGGEPLFAVKFTSQRGDRCQIARRAAEVLELDAALRVSFGQGLMLPKLGRSFARRTLAASSKRRTSLSSSGSVTPSLPPQPAPALTSSSSMPATIGADAASSPPGSPLIGVDEAAQLAAMSSALEKYLIALNSMPGVATCAELYDFLGIAETMTETDWHHLFEGTRQLHFAPNTLVLVEEEPNDHLFYIVDGAVAIERGSLQLQLLRQGSFFGEISAFLGQPNSSATVVARLVDRQGKLVEPERIDPSATAVTLCALPRDELTRRLVADPALGRRFAATVTLRLDQLLVALPLARVVGAQAKAVTDDEHTRRVAFQRMFHLTRHDTILHSYACAYARGVRTYHGELIISERCVTYAAKLFGSELQLKFYYASTSAIQCDDCTLTIKVDDQQVAFRFAQASEASNAHSNLRRRVTLQRELSRDKRRNTASPQLSRVNSSGEFPSPRSLDVTPRVRSPLSPSTSVSDVGASVAATASSPAVITDEAAAGARHARARGALLAEGWRRRPPRSSARAVRCCRRRTSRSAFSCRSCTARCGSSTITRCATAAAAVCTSPR
jgi:CRP-like cAMP-binding protein